MSGKKDSLNREAFRVKVALRMAVLESLNHKKPLRVLDAYSGAGDIYRMIKRHIPVETIALDKSPRSAEALKIDNRKYLVSCDLSQFDCIDLDAYGWPNEQIAILADRQYKNTIIFTLNSVGFAGIPMPILSAKNIPSEWHQVASSLFSAQSGIDVWSDYLYSLGFDHMLWVVISSAGGMHYYGVLNSSITKKDVIDKWHTWVDT